MYVMSPIDRHFCFNKHKTGIWLNRTWLHFALRPMPVSTGFTIEYSNTPTSQLGTMAVTWRCRYPDTSSHCLSINSLPTGATVCSDRRLSMENKTRQIQHRTRTTYRCIVSKTQHSRRSRLSRSDTRRRQNFYPWLSPTDGSAPFQRNLHCLRSAVPATCWPMAHEALRQLALATADHDWNETLSALSPAPLSYTYKS